MYADASLCSKKRRPTKARRLDGGSNGLERWRVCVESPLRCKDECVEDESSTGNEGAGGQAWGLDGEGLGGVWVLQASCLLGPVDLTPSDTVLGLVLAAALQRQSRR